MSEQDDIITVEDIDWLNRKLIAKSADVVRTAGTVLAAVGAVGVALVLWIHWRVQDQLSDADNVGYLGEPDQPGVGWQDHLDGFAQAYGLVTPGLAIALGLGLRLFADYAVVRTGGSLGPVAAGDAVPPEGPGDGGADDDAAPVEPEPVLPPNPEGYEPRA